MATIFSPENQQYISRRLKTRIILFFLISIVLLGILIYEVAIGDVSWWVALIALLAGIVIGFLYGRFSRVRWHETQEQIVMRYDVIGYLLIGAYILLSIFRDWFLGQFFAGAALEAISIAVAAGILFGRFFGLHIAIMRVLRSRVTSS